MPVYNLSHVETERTYTLSEKDVHDSLPAVGTVPVCSIFRAPQRVCQGSRWAPQVDWLAGEAAVLGIFFVWICCTLPRSQ